jgi:hypothetical protein
MVEIGVEGKNPTIWSFGLGFWNMVLDISRYGFHFS